MYWAGLLYAFAMFSGVVIATQMRKGSLETEDFLILALFGATTFAGCALGQGLAFLRVRTWVVLTFAAMCWGVACSAGMAGAGAAGVVGVVIFCILFLLPIAMTGGLWSLETHRALWSTWLPIVYSTGAIIVWAEDMGEDAAWHAGEKWAIWDIVTFFVLGSQIALILLYLVTRETHRLALWRRGPTAPLQPSVAERGAARPRLTILGFVLLMGTALVLSVATAVISPYLWRTGSGDGDDGGSSQQQTDDGGGSGTGDPVPDDGTGDRLQQLLQKAAEAAKQAGGAVCSMLTLAILGLIGFLVGFRPLKRLLTVRHLRDPIWQVTPTTRIEQGWRLVEIALGDVGVFPKPGEDAAGLARRARPVLEKISPVPVHGLEDAAEVADRVRFGLGVGPNDLAVMERFSGWAMDTVWERLSDREQVKCMYRGL
jgi:hypothetical protein